MFFSPKNRCYEHCRHLWCLQSYNHFGNNASPMRTGLCWLGTLFAPIIMVSYNLNVFRKTVIDPLAAVPLNLNASEYVFQPEKSIL